MERIGDLARIGMEVVVLQPDADMFVDVPAGTDACIPAVAARMAGRQRAGIAAGVVRVDVVVVICVEVAAMGTQVPALHQAEPAVHTQQPSVQRIDAGGLVDRLRMEQIADAKVAEVGITCLDAQPKVGSGLPAVAASKAIAGASAALTMGKVEAGQTAEVLIVQAVGATDVGVDEPVAGTDGLFGLVFALYRGVRRGAGIVLGKSGEGDQGSGGDHRGWKSLGHNEVLL